MADNSSQTLAFNIRRRLQDVPIADPECCICRVPNTPHRDEAEVYAPRYVSIGPLHRQRGQQMENLKSSYLHLFLRLNGELTEEDYIKVLGNLESKSRRCYSEQVLPDSNEFMEKLFVDGCFIIVLFLKFKMEVPRSLDDLIFNDAKLLNDVRFDLLFFENQIPFFVLQCLFNIAGVFNKGPSLVELALNFFHPILPGHRELIPADGVEIKHLLDLIRHSYAPSLAEIQPQEEDAPMELEYGACDLRCKLAVRFKKSSKARSLLDIRFHSDAVMEIPPFKIYVGAFSLFLNLIAYEQCFGGPDSYISDYVSFMASLLKSAQDEGLLSGYGIFENHLPYPYRYNPQVYEYFNFLNSKIVLRNSHYSKICKKVKRHCDSPWRVLLATIWHDFLRFPELVFLTLPLMLVVIFVVKWLFWPLIQFVLFQLQ